MKHFFLSLLAVIFFTAATQAQDKCATDDLAINKKEPSPQFEEWLNNKIQNRNIQRFGIQRQLAAPEVMQIPVVVHVIHNGEQPGLGSNISDAQIISQIEVLNEDFRRLNSDAVNTPAEFADVAADIQVEFVLARQDPEGLPTNGINRVDGHKSSWDVDEGLSLSSASYWPAEDYLNIWVTNLQEPYLGYAQFPISDLPGMDDPNHQRLTDGVVIDYFVFGSKEKFTSANLHQQYDMGRTTTHEIGHFLGLRHIWGDGGCNVDDYCSDTPPASKSNVGLSLCSFPGPNSCGAGNAGDLPDMFQNYMDYTDDRCMNLFTSDQKARIHTVLSNSPRRASLLSSKGLELPVLPPVNLVIKQVIVPSVAACGNEIMPQLQIQNFGEETITSATIELYIQDELREVREFQLENLEVYQTDTVTFNIQSFSPVSNLKVEYSIASVNGVSDDPAGNEMEILTPVLNIQSIPFFETFEEDISGNWTITDIDNSFHTWGVTEATLYSTKNKAIGSLFYFDNHLGTQELLTSSIFSLPQHSPAILSFDLAYARYATEKTEGLKVLISTNCGNTYEHVVFEKYGEQLQTTSPKTSSFEPSGPEEWRREVIDLSSFAGQNVRISFIAVNEYGNNLYLDNISLSLDTYTDAQLVKIISPSPARCDGEIVPEVLLKNAGASKIGSTVVEIRLNNNNHTGSFIFTDSIDIGESVALQFENVSAPAGNNNIRFDIKSINGRQDDNLLNNSAGRSFLIDNSEEGLPLRENFDNFTQSQWSILNLDDQLTWELVDYSSGNKYASFPSSKYPQQIDEDWILSPVMDFSTINEAAFFFDLRYDGNYSDRLQIVYTDDCGETYHPIGYDKSGTELSTYHVFKREYVSLNHLIGKSEVRLAIVATGTGGNNIEVDNLEVFLSDDPDPVVPDELLHLFPNPAREMVNLSFNLDQREDLIIEIIDYTGKIMSRHHLYSTLNQTHQLDLSAQPPGVYIVKISGESFKEARRLVIY